MRQEVKEFVAAGPLPNDDDDVAQEEFDRRQNMLKRIGEPVSREEAKALMACFPRDGAFGVEWTLLHLIETAVGGVPLPAERPPEGSNEFLLDLWDRADRAKRQQMRKAG